MDNKLVAVVVNTPEVSASTPVPPTEVACDSETPAALLIVRLPVNAAGRPLPVTCAVLAW